MKILTIIAVALLLGFNAKAQTISAIDMLEKVKCADQACFDGLAKEGFKYDETTSNSRVLKYSTKSGDAADAKNKLRFHLMPNKNFFTYWVGNAKTSAALINEFEVLGFTYKNDNELLGGKEYQSPKYPKYALIVGESPIDATVKTIQVVYTK
jgi:hypothetical protein